MTTLRPIHRLILPLLLLLLLLLISSPNNIVYGLLSPSSSAGVVAAGRRRTSHSSFYFVTLAELSSSAAAAADKQLPIIPTTTTTDLIISQMKNINWSTVTSEWEIDCYSRPVLLEDKKKLWEVLVSDSSGALHICTPLASNKVNSREVRRVIEEIISESEVKPEIIRFFRGAMFNMVRFYY